MLRGPDDARELAKKILQEKRFQAPEPSPIRRPLAWIGRQTSKLLRPISDAWSSLVSALGASPLLAVLVVLVVLAAVFFAVRRAAARRVGSFADPKSDVTNTEAIDPAVLEREADAAASAGDHDRAVRLRFRAGLVRLTGLGRLPKHEVTNGEARTQLREPEFEELADDFDEIVYGGREATETDSSDSQTRWPKLTGSSRR